MVAGTRVEVTFLPEQATLADQILRSAHES